MIWTAFVLVAQAAPLPVPTARAAAPAPAAQPTGPAPSPTVAPAPAAAPATSGTAPVSYPEEPPDEPEGPLPVAPAPATAPAYSPMAAPQPIAYAAPPQLAPPRPRRQFIVELAGGAYYYRLFSVQAYGGGGRMAFGSSGQANSWTVALEYLSGQTFHGLGLTMWHLGWSWDWHFDRLRFGLSPDFGITSLERATTFQRTLGQLSVGFDVHGSVDLVPIGGGSALFLRAVVNVDGTNNAPIWGPSLWLGARIGT
jgi:hypothetical protein